MLRPIEVHISSTLLEQTLRDTTASCHLIAANGLISPSNDVVVLPWWKVPSTWSNYTAHLAVTHLALDSLFSSTTMSYTIPLNAILCNNNREHTFEGFWTTHPSYDPENDTSFLSSHVVLILTRGTEQVIDKVTVHRLPGVTGVTCTDVVIDDGPSATLSADPILYEGRKQGEFYPTTLTYTYSGGSAFWSIQVAPEGDGEFSYGGEGEGELELPSEFFSGVLRHPQENGSQTISIVNAPGRSFTRYTFTLHVVDDNVTVASSPRITVEINNDSS